jgi:hypothetical protein
MIPRSEGPRLRERRVAELIFVTVWQHSVNIPHYAVSICSLSEA